MSCELELNADFNVSINILASGMGTIKTDGESTVFLLLRGAYSLRRQSNTGVFGHSGM